MLKELIYKRIPEKYKEEFLNQQLSLIKSRVSLFCLLAIGLYLFVIFVDQIINPGSMKSIDIAIGAILTIGGGLILYLNKKAQKLSRVKSSAALFTVFMLSLMIIITFDYPADITGSSALYVFTFFLVSITIPWTSVEIIPLWLLHILAFTISFLHSRYALETVGVSLSVRGYFDGVVFLAMAFWLCMIVRKKETERDVENFILFKEVADASKQMSKELEWATKVHKTIIPESIDNDKVDIAVSYLPVYFMGGDYTRFCFVGDNKLIFIIVDITGHGVPAALLVNRVHAEFERLAKDGKNPGELLEQLNEFIRVDFEGSNMYFSAFCGLVDFKKMKLLFSNYGHPSQYVYGKEKEKVYELSSQTTLLGLPVEDNKVYQDEMEIYTGDKILLFTDGVIETVDNSNEEYGANGVKRFLKKNYELKGDNFNEALLDDLDAYKDGKFKDDICILSIDVKYHQSLFKLKK